MKIKQKDAKDTKKGQMPQPDVLSPLRDLRYLLLKIFPERLCVS